MPRVSFKIDKEAAPVYPVYNVGDVVTCPFTTPKIGAEITDLKTKLSVVNGVKELTVTATTVVSVEQYVNSRTGFEKAMPKYESLQHGCEQLFYSFKGSQPDHIGVDGHFAWRIKHMAMFGKEANSLLPLHTRFANAGHAVLVNDLLNNSTNYINTRALKGYGVFYNVGIAGHKFSIEHVITLGLPIGQYLLATSSSSHDVSRLVGSHYYRLGSREEYRASLVFQEALKHIVQAAKALHNMKLLRSDTKKEIGAKRRNLASIEAIGMFMGAIKANDQEALVELKSNPTVVFNAILPWANKIDWFNKHHAQTWMAGLDVNNSYQMVQLYRFYLEQWNGKERLNAELGLKEYVVLEKI